MPATFQAGTDWEQSSDPVVNVEVQELDCWPVANNAIAAKDDLASGLHPVIAIGPRTAAAGRPLNITGVVVDYVGTGAGTGTDRVTVNIADGVIVRQYVNNTLTYAQTEPDTFVTAPMVGTPVYVDDSAALAAGVTLSMSPFNSTGTLKNPQAGVLWYCQDEIADGYAGGLRAASTFDVSLPDEETEQEYCVLLFNGSRELS